jgi:ABC-type branched-subunit amino acid transport system substrate-binding protein
VSLLKENNIDVLYVGGYHTEAGLMVRQMREQGMDTQLISGDALVTDEYWSITGDAGEGTLMTFGPDPRELPSAIEVVERFRANGIEPEGYTLYTYAAIQVFPGGGDCRLDRSRRGDRGAARQQLRHGAGRAQLRRQGRHPAAGLCLVRVVRRNLRVS